MFSTRTKLILIGCLAAIYLFYTWQAGARIPPDWGWRTPLSLSVVIVPIAVIVLCFNRDRLVPTDFQVTYLPIAVWFLSATVFKIMMWEITDGQAFLGSYGRDKGMFNVLIVEPPMIVLLQSAYVLRFLFPRLKDNEAERARARRFLIGVAVAAMLVAVIVPPLPD